MGTQVDMVWESWARLSAHGNFLTQIWHTSADRVSDITPLLTIKALHDEMTHTYEASHDFVYSFIPEAHTWRDGGLAWRDDAPPMMVMSASMSCPKGCERGVANQALVTFRSSTNRDWSVVTPLPVEWLLGIGASLVEDCVDVWRPDSVSLDCGALMRRDLRPGFAYPVVGFVSWFSDGVVDPSKLPATPIRRRYGSGTLIGVSPDSPDLLGDALALAKTVYQAGVLSMVPFVQGQPNPV